MTDEQVAAVASEADEWKKALRRETISFVALALAWLVLELSDEDSRLRYRLRWWWNRTLREIAGPDRNHELATEIARGVEYTSLWLERQWNNRKETR